MSEQLSLKNMLKPGAPTITVTLAHHLSVGRHSHDFYELVYIRDGFCLHDVDEKTTLLTEGDLFMLRPGQFHRYAGNRVVNIINCLFSKEQIPDALYTAFAFPKGDIPHIHLELGERKNVLRLLLSMMEELTNAEAGWEIKLKGMLNCLLVDYGRMYGRRIGPDGQNQAYMGYVLPSLSYIDRRYAEDISVREIAEAVGVSGDYLARQFKQAIGLAPLEYIRRYRLGRAMDMLQKNATVTYVAERVGFGSLSHFSREFKKELGITPTQYKKQYQ